MQWIKEVEMLNAVDDLKSSCSIQGCAPFPNFELLDARIASTLNKIIWNSDFKKKVSLEEQDYADLFTVVLRNDDIQEFDTRCVEILLSMEQCPPDDILEKKFVQIENTRV